MGSPAGRIREILGKHPVAGLTVAPTPLYKLSRLSSRLGNVVYVLREDMTGFALGGNKVRKLDYLIGDALATGADALVTSAASSFSRNAAAAGRVCGLEVHVLIPGDVSDHNPLSRAFFDQYGATLHYIDEDAEGGLSSAQGLLVQELKSHGRVVHELHPGGSDEIGTLGYLQAFAEIVEYTRATGTHFHRIVLATGSAGTQAGLVIGQGVSRYETQVVGMAISQPTEIQRERVRRLVTSTATRLGIEDDVGAVIVDDRFLGDGYAIESREGQQAVELFAHLEGLHLDQVYGGKAAAGLLHLSKHGEPGAGENTLFLHTGGNAGLFY